MTARSIFSEALRSVRPDPPRVLVSVVAVAVALCGCQVDRPSTVSVSTPKRIVSMSPGLTETLFALGVGDRVVGVTRFCTHPAEVASRARVGGFLDPNWEAIVALEPDLVVIMESHGAVEARLTGLGITSLRVDQHDVESVLGSFEVVARACGVADRGTELRRAVVGRINRVERAVAAAPRPGVLIVVGRNAGSGDIQSVWAAASGTFNDDVVSLAGGKNVLADTGLGAHPEISREGLISLSPEVILDVIPDLRQRGLDAGQALADWGNMDAVRAVREQRVIVLAEPFMATPGPRMAAAVETVARALHPEIAW